MKDKACKDCHYATISSIDNNNFTHYECRFNPPTALQWHECKGYNFGIWPKVASDDWCWQFKEANVEGGRRWDDES